MAERVSTASWNIVGDSLDCSLKLFGAIADCVQDEFEWADDLLAARSPQDVISAWSRYSSKLILKGIAQRETAIEMNCRLWRDYTILSQASGLLPEVGAPRTNASKVEVLSPENEVLLLHVIE